MVSGTGTPGSRNSERPGTDSGLHHTEVVMGTDDKIDNKVEEAGGKVKEHVGRATDDRDLEAEGKADQSSSHVKQAVEHVKDAFKS
ncbi:hypothetical protein JCM9534A_14430 [Catenuloplanes indicus JCM 9534]